jgi:glycosyltransferase involved in cell wall biosynthesis
MLSNRKSGLGQKNSFLIGSDVEALSRLDYVTGIQRVVIESHKYLSDKLPQSNSEIKGFITKDSERMMNYRNSAYYTSDPVIHGDLAKLSDLDLVLLLDLNWGFSFPSLMKERQERNLPVISIIYDFLPIHHPEWFPVEGAKTAFRVYLQKLIAVSDHIIFNSKKVEDDFKNLGWNFSGETHVFPLGAFEKSRLHVPHISPPKTIITVSTIEPRKGQLEIIEAFDLLLKSKENYNLLIVGRYGWKSEDLVCKIYSHPEYGGRLRWFQNLNDSEIAALYDGSSIAVAGSFDEGFGLNIEEALSHNLKVVARDIPVFRERAQPNLYFFEGGAKSLHDAILKAEDSPWDSFTNKNLRAMNDFSQQLYSLINNILSQS